MDEKIKLRPGTSEDQEFLYNLKKITLKEYVLQVWGWDEDFQRSRHNETVDPNTHEIIQFSEEDIGCIKIEVRPETLFLSVIGILPSHQNQGIGTKLISDLITRGQQEEKNIELQVLKVNRKAHRLYQNLGFVDSGETDTHFLMEYLV